MKALNLKTKIRFTRSEKTGSLSAIASSIALLLLATACGSSSEMATPSSSVTVSGSLSAAGTVARMVNPTFDRTTEIAKIQTTSFSGTSVTCTTLTNPPTTATAKVDSTGSFSVWVNKGLNKPMNCNLIDSSGNNLAAIVTSDASNTDMNGNPTTQSTLTFGSSANLGSITYDPSTGTVAVPITAVQSAIVAAATDPSSVYDPSGNWTVSNVSFDLPTGYTMACAAGDKTCVGPTVGQNIALQLFKGVKVANTSKSVYALQVWNGGAAAQNACGNVTGLTSADASSLGIDFTSTGKMGAFTYATSVTINGASQAVTNDYQIAGAVSATATQSSCSSQTVNVGGLSSLAYVCSDSSGHYQANLGGGCIKNSNRKAIKPSAGWTPSGTCTTTSIGNGYIYQTCQGTYQSIAVSCTNVYGVFSDSALTIPSTASFNWSYLNSNSIAAGTSCSSSSFSSLQKAQCYAQYFQQYVGPGTANANACLKRLDTDWSATTPWAFLHVRSNPSSLVAFNTFHPDHTGTGGGIRSTHNQIQAVQASSGQGFTSCHTTEVDDISFKKIDDHTLLTTYQVSTITTDTTLDDCVATFGSASGGSVQNFMFLLTK